MKKVLAITLAVIICAAAIIVLTKNDGGQEDELLCRSYHEIEEEEEKKYIKWVDFTPSCSLMKKAIDYDIQSFGQTPHMNWIELLAYTAAKCGGKFNKNSASDMQKLVERLQQGETMEQITDGMRFYGYYEEAYTAVLAEYIGEYEIQLTNDMGEQYWDKRYGLKVYSPIAKGFGFGHYRDFGVERTYGYKRKHLGNDLMGTVGIPIVAIEGGYVEALGWNEFGGWRIGIRSYDKLRYYYYAHLRKDHPYVKTLKEGDTVEAGEVIGYMGLTGYSKKENVNNLKRPHLHLGVQLIFDESQKDGVNQIWIDLYEIVELLQQNKADVMKIEETGEYVHSYRVREVE